MSPFSALADGCDQRYRFNDRNFGPIRCWPNDTIRKSCEMNSTREDGTNSVFLFLVDFLQSTLEEWRLVFWITFAIFAVTTVVYSIWASGEVQPWNYPKNHVTTAEAGNVVEYHDDEKNATEKL